MKGEILKIPSTTFKVKLEKLIRNWIGVKIHREEFVHLLPHLRMKSCLSAIVSDTGGWGWMKQKEKGKIPAQHVTEQVIYMNKTQLYLCFPPESSVCITSLFSIHREQCLCSYTFFLLALYYTIIPLVHPTFS